MAQERRMGPARRARALARRYGITGTGVAVAAVAVALVVAMAGVGVWRMGASPGIEVERGEDVAGGVGCEGSSEDAGGQGSPSVAGVTDAAPAGSPEGSGERTARRVVHVDGAVNAPGVYVVESDDPRVNDVVALAGGLAEDADTTSLNLAAPVEDGQKVHVPLLGEEPVAEAGGQEVAVASPQAEPAAGGLINVNVAGPEELTALPGVGEATAAAIVEERERNGAFASVDDLARVSGIGPKKLEKLRDKACV